MPEPSWKEIRELTRLRRRQSQVVRAGPYHEDMAARRLYARAEIIPIDWDRIRAEPSPLIEALWLFQKGHCYICVTPMDKVTKDHVHPKNLGGEDAHNILLACGPCNTRKGNREPTTRELALLAAAYNGDEAEWHRWMMQYDDEKPLVTVKGSAFPTRRF